MKRGKEPDVKRVVLGARTAEVKTINRPAFASDFKCPRGFSTQLRATFRQIEERREQGSRVIRQRRVDGQ
jgi:hypothetical protein